MVFNFDFSPPINVDSSIEVFERLLVQVTNSGSQAYRCSRISCNMECILYTLNDLCYESITRIGNVIPRIDTCDNIFRNCRGLKYHLRSRWRRIDLNHLTTKLRRRTKNVVGAKFPLSRRERELKTKQKALKANKLDTVFFR